MICRKTEIESLIQFLKMGTTRIERLDRKELFEETLNISRSMKISPITPHAVFKSKTEIEIFNMSVLLFILQLM